MPPVPAPPFPEPAGFQNNSRNASGGIKKEGSALSIAVIGSVFVDIKGYPNGTYIPGGRNAGRVRYLHGGVCRNVAEDLGNMGLNPLLISLVDDSGTAADVVHRLNEHGVDTRYVRQAEDGMGTWLAVFDNNNDVCASISHRPDLSTLLQILQENGNEIFSSADSILLELDMKQDVVEETYRLKQKFGTKIYAAISNISLALENREYLRITDGFVCNRQEAEILFSDGFSGMEPEALARQLSVHVQDGSIPAMVVTLGGDGAIWADREGMYGTCAAQQVPVADTTGAGDAFFAGVAAGLTYGKNLAQACSIGTRLASSVVCSLENVCPKFLPAEFGL